MKKSILYGLFIILFLTVHESFCEERENPKITEEANNVWKKDKLTMIYYLHEDHTLRRFIVRYDGVFVCAYNIGKAGSQSGSLLVQPQSGFSVNLTFIDIGKDILNLELRKEYEENILIVRFGWDSVESKFLEEEYSYEKIDPNPFGEEK